MRGFVIVASVGLLALAARAAQADGTPAAAAPRIGGSLSPAPAPTTHELVLATRGVTQELPGAAAWRSPQPGCTNPCAPADDYIPSLPIGETRSAWTALAVGPTPFALTAGEALTPRRGRIAVGFSRLSDERFLDDLAGRRWNSDGEIQILDIEYVSRRLRLRMGSLGFPLHWSASIHAYSLEHAIFDGLRNFVEEDLLNSEPGVRANHRTGGRALTIAGEELLDSAPLFKFRAGLKFPLPTATVWGQPFYSAVGVGLTLPAFGSMRKSGNEDLQPDLSVAYRYAVSDSFFLTGALDVSVPGSTQRLRTLGVDTADVLFGGHADIEYWISRSWAAGFGFQYQTNYLDGTGIAMDESSIYFNLGFLFRLHQRHALYVVFSENPESTIAFGPARDYSSSQKDADFTLLFGWRFEM